jgi:flagella basal body P-ring formation protein FlgA
MRQACLLWLLAAASAWAQPASCTDVHGDQILAADLARALPAFRAIAPDTSIAPAPSIGGMRVFSKPELETLGRRFGMQVSILPHEICFRVPTAPLNREAVLAAMKQSLPAAETRIALEDISPDPAPPGTIQFPIEGLGRPALPDSPALWRGEVVSGSRRFSVWARAKITAPVARLVALENLKPGVPIQPQQLRTDSVVGFPALATTGLPTLETVTGMTPLHAIPAGSEIRMENLVRPYDVARGDLVHVEVRMGKTRLSLNGRAEAAGRMGDLIAVRNPQSDRVFQARVAGKDSVLVDPLPRGAE